MLALTISGASAACSAPLDISTGVGPLGATDPKWTVDIGDEGAPFIVNPISAWVIPDPGAHWISPNVGACCRFGCTSFCPQNVDNRGDVDFTYLLSGFADPGNIAVKWAADNSAEFFTARTEARRLICSGRWAPRLSDHSIHLTSLQAPSMPLHLTTSLKWWSQTWGVAKTYTIQVLLLLNSPVCRFLRPCSCSPRGF